MNGLVPVLVAVILAEFGPRATLYANARPRDPSIWLIAASIIAAAIAGELVAPSLTGWADAFLIAIALTFAALGQVQAVKPVTNWFAVVVGFWHGGVPLIAFAFATRFGAPAVAAGALAGLVASAALTRITAGGPEIVRPIRWAAAGILLIAAAITAIGALRLA